MKWRLAFWAALLGIVGLYNLIVATFHQNLLSLLLGVLFLFVSGYIAREVEK